MTTFLNALSQFFYTMHRSRAANVGIVATLLACVGLIAAGRPQTKTVERVFELTPDTSLSTALNNYFSVRGTLLTTKAYENKVSIASIQLTGSRYVPLQTPQFAEPIFVLDENLPKPDANGTVAFTARLATGQGGPTYYLIPESPANIPLINKFAYGAMALAGVLLIGALLGLWVSKSDYALATATHTNPETAQPRWVWYGKLNSEWGNASVREGSVKLNKASPNLLQLESTSTPTWRVAIRKAQQVQPTTIASSMGAVPALRIWFEDERGLMRKGTLGTNSAQARDELVQTLAAGYST